MTYRVIRTLVRAMRVHAEQIAISIAINAPCLALGSIAVFGTEGRQSGRMNGTVFAINGF